MTKHTRLQNAGFWIISILLTLAFASYQRMTGPTYPIKGNVSINDQKIKYKLLRTWGGEKDARVEIDVPGSITGEVLYKRYKSNDEWTKAPLTRDGGNLVATLPHQPPAGKIMYQITLNSGESSVKLGEEPIVIRFKGDVPAVVLISTSSSFSAPC